MKKDLTFIQEATLLMALKINNYDNWNDVGRAIYGKKFSVKKAAQFKRDVNIDLAEGNLINFVDATALIEYILKQYSHCFMNNYLIDEKNLPHILKVGRWYIDDITLSYEVKA